MQVNFGYPRCAVIPGRPRPCRATSNCSTSTPDSLNSVPVLWTVFGGILLLGAVYYFGVQTKKPFVPVVAPADQ